jgi:glyoxylase-like metal-dependent hydrolase (beta-lactamase superfamily II)
MSTDPRHPRVEPTPVPLPSSRAATVEILTEGYVGERVAGTVGLVVDGSTVAVVDPGMVRHRSVILDPLVTAGFAPEDVTDVIFSHHHPDHTLHAALFPSARFHDHWAIYRGDEWISRPAEGFEVSPSVRLVETPGHSPQDLTTLVGTPDGIVAFTHLWWHERGPAEDPRATDAGLVHVHRPRILAVADVVVPGHGPAFRPDDDTPR